MSIAITGEDMFENDQDAKVFLGILTKKSGDPADRPRTLGMRVLERLDLAQVVPGSEARLVKGKVDDQLPVAARIFERGVWQVANVFE